MSFAKLSDLLGRSARKKGISAQVEAAMILEFFKQVTKDMFEEKARSAISPLHVRDGTLTVATLSPALAQELKLREREIIDGINAKSGRKVVSALRFLS